MTISNATRTLRVLLAVLALAWGPLAAEAVVISFEVTDVPDLVAGEDLWQYTYSVSEFTPVQDLAFETLFDETLYRGLEDPPPFVNADWDLLSLQPDPGLPDAGRYSALALVDGASLADPFSLTFVWLGGPGTAPGRQPFEINRFDAGGAFLGTLETGLTIPLQPPTTAVPAPASLVLVAAAMLGLLGARRYR